MQTINFGIDLGTTNSAIAVYKNGEVTVFKNPATLKEMISSVVAFKGERIIIGDKAKEVLTKKPQNVFGSFKRKMGTSNVYSVGNSDQTVTPIELSSMVLKELKNFIHSGENMDAAVITIPAAFDTIQSNATKKAGYLAGLKEVVLLQEPIAASLAFANQTDINLEEGKWLVYDLGGGTFDVALATIEEGEMKILDHEGDNFLGGSDFDNAIIEHFIVPELEKLGDFSDLFNEMKNANGKYNRLYNRLLYISEEAKILLTTQSVAEIEFDIEDENVNEIEVYLELSKEKFNAIIAPFIHDTVGMISTIIERNQLQNNDINCILLIGGSTYVPAVKTTLADKFDVPINSSVDPTTAVVVGAAYYAGMKQKRVLATEEDTLSKFEKTSNIELKLAYEKVAQDTSTILIGQIQNGVKDENYTYRILRTDSGFDSGILPLKDKFSQYITLVPNSFNAFNVTINDELGNKVHQQEIGIMHGKFSIDGQPLPNHICIELDALEDNTTFLEPVFKKNDILPLRKTIIKQVSETIRKDSDASLTLKVLEGDIDSLPDANKLIGLVQINGKDLERDLVKGSDVELIFEMSESRDLKVTVYLTLTDQEIEKSFNPSEMHIDAEVLLASTNNLRKNVLQKQKKFELEENFESASSSQHILKEIEDLEDEIKGLNKQDTSDTKFKIYRKKQELGKRIHQLFNTSYLTKTIEDYYHWRGIASSWLGASEAIPADTTEFEQITNSQNDFLRAGVISTIKMKMEQLKGLANKIANRTPFTNEDIASHYLFYKNQNYDDAKTANRLIAEGDAAESRKDYIKLLNVLNKLSRLKDDEKRNNSGIFRNNKTGLK